MQILPLSIALLTLIFSSNLYAEEDPCKGTNLKRWAIKAGYPTDYCANQDKYESQNIEDIASTTLNPCRKNGDLKRWARKASYDPAICTSTTPIEEIVEEVTTPETPIITNTAPSLVITSPSSGASIEQGTATPLTAIISDAEDGSDLTISWLSSIDGNMTDIASLSTGSHIITAQTTDSGGLSTSQLISITITDPTPPAIEKQSATLSWIAPTTRSNGEALLISEIQGYEIYMVDDNNILETVITIDGGDISSYIFEELPPGGYHFAIATIDSSNLISELSEPVSLTIQ